MELFQSAIGHDEVVRDGAARAYAPLQARAPARVDLCGDCSEQQHSHTLGIVRIAQDARLARRRCNTTLARFCKEEINDMYVCK